MILKRILWKNITGKLYLLSWGIFRKQSPLTFPITIMDKPYLWFAEMLRKQSFLAFPMTIMDIPY